MAYDDSDSAGEWARKAAASCGPQIKQSHVFASIIAGNWEKDPIMCLQLGLAIMMGKPIMLLAGRDEKLPAALVRAADRIERADLSNEEDMKRAMNALGEFANSVAENKNE